MLVVLLASGALCSACQSPRLSCPSGTERRSNTDKSVTDYWCARANGERHGPYMRTRKGVRKRTGSYRNGLAHGPWRQYNPKGALTGIYIMHEGTGVEVTWTTSSLRKTREIQKVRGVPHGFYTRWHSNGRYETIGRYKGGTKHGRWYKWDRNGKAGPKVTVYVQGVAQDATVP